MAEATSNPLPLDTLLAAIQAGDESAVAVFVQRYEPMLRRVLRVTGVIRWLQSQVESQDLVQLVFIQVIDDVKTGAVQFSDEARLENYLKKVGRNQLRQHIRRLKAAKRDQQRTVAAGPEVMGQVAETAPSPSQMLSLREQVERVERCTLPDDLEILRERANGAPWQELADQLDTTREAARKRIERVRKQIRENLGE